MQVEVDLGAGLGGEGWRWGSAVDLDLQWTYLPDYLELSERSHHARVAGNYFELICEVQDGCSEPRTTPIGRNRAVIKTGDFFSRIYMNPSFERPNFVIRLLIATRRTPLPSRINGGDIET